jgi:hypothetical protein
MMEAPKISPDDWITVDGGKCVVCLVYKPNSHSGIGMVVFNKIKPTTHDVEWDGEKWFFPKRSDFGGYGRDGDKYVIQLRRGF